MSKKLYFLLFLAISSQLSQIHTSEKNIEYPPDMSNGSEIIKISYSINFSKNLEKISNEIKSLVASSKEIFLDFSEINEQKKEHVKFFDAFLDSAAKYLIDYKNLICVKTGLSLSKQSKQIDALVTHFSQIKRAAILKKFISQKELTAICRFIPNLEQLLFISKPDSDLQITEQLCKLKKLNKLYLEKKDLEHREKTEKLSQLRLKKPSLEIIGFKLDPIA